MSTRIQLRRGTAAQWASANPVLLAGEEGLETDTGKVKIGDGTSAWSALNYRWPFDPTKVVITAGVIGGVPVAPVLDVGALAEPFCIAHRGAGALIAPEGTTAAYKTALSYGTTYIADGGDWYDTADGAIFDVHNSDLSQVTNLTGTMISQIAAAMRRCLVTASTWFGFGYSDQTGTTAPEDVFPILRGRMCCSPEAKSAKAAPILANYLAGLGMHKQCLPNAFQDAWLTTFANLGFPYLARNVLAGAEHATLADPTAGAARCQALLALGVKYVILDAADANANAARLIAQANGIKVGCFTSDAAVGSALTKQSQKVAIPGYNFYVADDPLYFMGDTTKYRRSTDPYRFNAGPYHGHHDRYFTRPPTTSTKRGSIANGRLVMTNSDTQNNFVLQGWGSPIANAAGSYTIAASIKFTATPADRTRWAALVVCCPDDAVYTDTGSTSNGYQIWIRPSAATGGGSAGDVNIARKTAGASGATQTGALSGEITAGSTVTATVAITPTTITVTVSGAVTGTVTITDSAFRGAYFHVGHAAIASGTLTVEFGPIGIS